MVLCFALFLFGGCKIKKICGGRYCFYIDTIKWLSALTLLILAVIGSYLYRDWGLFYRIIVDVCVVLVAGYLVLLTNRGGLLVVFFRESYSEVRKVIWPTFRESVYTTAIVIIATILVSLILWSLDGLLVRIVSFGLRL
ncbi:preprotein translocase subunit SecE [Blochmannia endosymbiont of Polyrhachis (Hedomyrma) turneri]|uniref:preprotein translocase subunit SecE n=1 Tax=Blochmannia endosymbiont of Polyrhachis (Hedomyrma) turneri TaxID=1505596 RepID=UPI00061A5F79|nr:preprotein translocase subunit SecE [Blochmannia endosymbiont of Polyrhachis (Hedomyrma) turneri]AKC60121.1 preprotein translocase subunit SecE [Blochmannia endosymbiont of Polyrhachis (Hedomyrma) turneri]